MFARIHTLAAQSTLLCIVLATCCALARGQASSCPQEAADHLVRSVRIKARWLPETGSSPFELRDLRDANRLLLKLKTPGVLSDFVLSKLTTATVTLIKQYDAASGPSPALKKAIVDDLNRLLGAPLIFQKEAFAQVTISANTQKLFAEKPTRGEGLFRLNRMLLEDAYPNELARDAKVFLALQRGEEFTPERMRSSRFEIIQAINEQKKKFNSEFINLGKLPLVDVNLVTACVREVPAKTCEREGLTSKCVDVEIHPYAISTDPVFMGSVLLPLPRSNQFSFLGSVPRMLRLLNPKMGLSQDKELSSTPEFEISTDLLSMGSVLDGEPAEGRKASLLLKANAARSIGERYYTSQAQLSFLVRQPSKHVESLGLTASFGANSQPELKSINLSNTLRLGGQLILNPELGFINRAVIEGGYRRANQRLSGDLAPIATSENAFEGRAILEGRIFNGFSRFGFWVDGGKPQNNQQTYSRFAALIGYEKELPVGEHTVGVEAMFGAGRASARTPNYALFYGGNALSSFLYEDTNDPMLTSMPAGPVLRSFGKNQAGFVIGGQTRAGASSYQHLNLNVSIPIPRLSAPLIPNEIVIPSPPKTLRSLINFAVNSGQEALSVNLQDEGLSEEEADKQAAKIFNQIRPGVGFLTNYGKIYAVKPLIMFDYTRMTRSGSGASQTRYALGGGVQFTIVVAKFEAGYMHTLHRQTNDSGGNFIMRMIFQNLF